MNTTIYGSLGKKGCTDNTFPFLITIRSPKLQVLANTKYRSDPLLYQKMNNCVASLVATALNNGTDCLCQGLALTISLW